MHQFLTILIILLITFPIGTVSTELTTHTNTELTTQVYDLLIIAPQRQQGPPHKTVAALDSADDVVDPVGEMAPNLAHQAKLLGCPQVVSGVAQLLAVLPDALL